MTEPKLFDGVENKSNFFQNMVLMYFSNPTPVLDPSRTGSMTAIGYN